MPDDRKPTSRSRKPASPSRKPASRARTPKDEPLEEQDLDAIGLDEDDDDLEAAPSDRARPIAVGVTGATDVDDEPVGALAGGLDEPLPSGDVLTDTVPEPSTEGVVERPLVELGVGLVALLLALSTILKSFGWFEAVSAPGVTPGASGTGWAISPVGPLVFFLALAVIAIIVMRRIGFAIAFPFETSTIVEGIGYLAVGLLLATRFLFVPAGWAIRQGGWITSVVLAAGLFLLAGMMSSSAPLVLKPGWFGARAGKVGAITVGIALLGGAAFGLVNDPPGPKACGEDLPRHSSMKALKLTSNQQAGGKAVCVGFAPVSASPSTLKKFYVKEFKELGWKHTVKTTKRAGGGNQMQTLFQLLGPKYGGTVLIFHTGKTSLVNVIIAPPRDFGHCQETKECIYE
jgi:hypothetical protein